MPNSIDRSQGSASTTSSQSRRKGWLFRIKPRKSQKGKDTFGDSNSKVASGKGAGSIGSFFRRRKSSDGESQFGSSSSRGHSSPDTSPAKRPSGSTPKGEAEDSNERTKVALDAHLVLQDSSKLADNAFHPSQIVSSPLVLEQGSFTPSREKEADPDSPQSSAGSNLAYPLSNIPPAASSEAPSEGGSWTYSTSTASGSPHTPPSPSGSGAGSEKTPEARDTPKVFFAAEPDIIHPNVTLDTIPKTPQRPERNRAKMRGNKPKKASEDDIIASIFPKDEKIDSSIPQTRYEIAPELLANLENTALANDKFKQKNHKFEAQTFMEAQRLKTLRSLNSPFEKLSPAEQKAVTKNMKNYDKLAKEFKEHKAQKTDYIQKTDKLALHRHMKIYLSVFIDECQKKPDTKIDIDAMLKDQDALEIVFKNYSNGSAFEQQFNETADQLLRHQLGSAPSEGSTSGNPAVSKATPEDSGVEETKSFTSSSQNTDTEAFEKKVNDALKNNKIVAMVGKFLRTMSVLGKQKASKEKIDEYGKSVLKTMKSEFNISEREFKEIVKRISFSKSKKSKKSKQSKKFNTGQRKTQPRLPTIPEGESPPPSPKLERQTSSDNAVSKPTAAEATSPAPETVSQDNELSTGAHDYSKVRREYGDHSQEFQDYHVAMMKHLQPQGKAEEFLETVKAFDAQLENYINEVVAEYSYKSDLNNGQIAPENLNEYHENMLKTVKDYTGLPYETFLERVMQHRQQEVEDQKEHTQEYKENNDTKEAVSKKKNIDPLKVKLAEITKGMPEEEAVQVIERRRALQTDIAAAVSERRAALRQTSNDE